MFKTFLRDIPNKYVWLANLLFWLVLNTLATDNSYRQRLSRNPDIDLDWWAMWIGYLPWWTLWAGVAPLVFAATKQVTFNSKKPLQFVFQHCLLMLVFLVAMFWGLTIILSVVIETQDFTWSNIKMMVHYWQLSLLHIDFLVYLAIVCAGYTAHYYAQSKAQLLQNEKLAHQLVQVELQSLKSQLNPHFLFNTLNTIASLIRLGNKQGAVNALSELSLMLRKVLEHQGDQLISVQEELKFIQSYLSIQQLRFENKLIIEVDVDEHCLTAEIPFMLLQPLVENAVQHGSQMSSNQNILTLAISCQQELLIITLTNKVPKYDEHQGFGIGLKNTRERLTKLYGSKFQLTLSPLKDDYFKTSLSLPCGEPNV
ncbi:MAG: sensor histidine kinase [Cognaticolwellia sp.]